MIDQFTKKDFEDYLSTNYSPFNHLGLVDGEETYELHLDNQVSIIIRSSIRSDNLSADVGKDSIRVWLQSDGKPISSRIARTHRTENWQNRLSEKMNDLTFKRALFGDCKECGRPKRILKSRTEKNKNRIFARCSDHENSFIWLEDAIEFIRKNEVYFSKESKNDTGKTGDIKKGKMAYNCKSANDDLQPGSAGKVCTYANEISRPISSMSTVSREPNEAQRKAIETDIETNLRVLAGPGSGKTFIIALRYEYLVKNGVNPRNILVCTFGKEASMEMAKRIQKSVTQANLEQICTINALCFRLLTKWYPDSRWFGWKMPTEWQTKKCLEDAIGSVWQKKEKPNVREVMNYINISKYHGLTNDDSYQWFIDALGQQYGKWLYDIRCRFDAWLNRNQFITYTDQLYLVEKRLQTDEVWRTGLQERFSHVIVDEAQDVNFQALRILITISLEPGMNTVYEVK